MRLHEKSTPKLNILYFLTWEYNCRLKGDFDLFPVLNGGVCLFGGKSFGVSGGDRLLCRRSPPDKTSATANFHTSIFPLRPFQLQSGSPAHFKASAFKSSFRASKGLFAHLETNLFGENSGATAVGGRPR